MKTITVNQILSWHGEGDNESLANLIAEVLNGKYSIKDFRKDVLNYSFDTDEEDTAQR